MEIRTIHFGSAEHAATLALRREVMGDPGSPPFSAEEDDVHLGLFDGAELLGCLVLTVWSDTMLQVRQVCVHTGHRRRGMGKRMMDASEGMARERGFRYVVLYARSEAVEFYRALGYRYCDEWPVEDAIPSQMSAKAIA